MRIHAIQTGTVVIKERQCYGEGHGTRRLLNTLLDKQWVEPLPIYAWAVEHPEGVIIIDTGETARVSEPGYFPRWNPYYRVGLKEFVKPEEEIGPQLEGLGISPSDARWVIMTHLHTDHAGGLSYFPNAEIIVSQQEYQTATSLRGRVRGYLPHRWPSWFAPRLIDYEPKPVGPFPESLAVTAAGDVCLVPTQGHAVGHLSVILQDGDLSFFFAGDASYNEELMLGQIVDGVTTNEQKSAETLQRILQYVGEVPTVFLPTHDTRAGERLMARKTVSF